MGYKQIDIYNNIFITGKPGIGKTYYIKEQIKADVGEFTVEDCKVMIENKESRPWEPKIYTGIRFVTTGEIQKRAFDFEFLDGIMKCKLLIVDDFGVSEHARRVCDVVLDLLSNRQGHTIITSNLTLKDIGEKLDERISSRLSSFVLIGSDIIGSRNRRTPEKSVKDIFK